MVDWLRSNMMNPFQISPTSTGSRYGQSIVITEPSVNLWATSSGLFKNEACQVLSLVLLSLSRA